MNKRTFQVVVTPAKTTRLTIPDESAVIGAMELLLKNLFEQCTKGPIPKVEIVEEHEKPVATAG